MNLASNLARTAQAQPSATAIKLDDLTIPYAALAQGAARVAGWLTELGVRPGDRVAITMPNLPQFPIIYYGILWAGGAVVPMNPLFKSREVVFALRDSDARAVFAWEGMADEARAGAAAVDVPFIEVGALRILKGGAEGGYLAPKGLIVSPKAVADAANAAATAMTPLDGSVLK